MEKISYALGMVIGHNLKGMGVNELDAQNFAQAVGDVLSGNPTTLSDTEAQQLVTRFLQEKENEKGKEVREAGEAFLATNAKKEGITVLPSGLQYTVINEGSGRKPKATDSVKCHYEGFLTDGTLFDSSLQRGEPAVFGLQQVIAGWTEGLQLMQEGAKYRFFIPYKLGYGESGAGQSIPPYSALVFDVELIKVM